MREIELNTVLNIIPDPEKNVYDISTRKSVEEIKRIVRIFKLAEAQKAEKILTATEDAICMNLVLSIN